MTAGEKRGGGPEPSAGSTGPIVALAAVGLAGAGVALARTGRANGVAGGILLLVAALALAGVALGGAPRGTALEGRLDLGTRLGLGLLGGLLGAVVALAAQWAVSALGIPAVLGVDVAGIGETGGGGARLLRGSVWGLVFGVLLPWVPGPGVIGRGAVFSLVPSLLTLLVVFPSDPDAGALGVGRGTLTFVFVLLLNGLWGLVAAWTVGWAERSDLAPLSAPLGE